MLPIQLDHVCLDNQACSVVSGSILKNTLSSPVQINMETEARDMGSAACLIATKCAQEQEKEDAKAYLISVIAAVLEGAVRINDSKEVVARIRQQKSAAVPFMPIPNIRKACNLQTSFILLDHIPK